MPTLTPKAIKNLVRKVGAGSRPGQQKQALQTIMSLTSEGFPTMETKETLAAIAATGAIPPLVWMLRPGQEALLQKKRGRSPEQPRFEC
ncbi:hypothetical protein FOA52_003225 [Chlamydomonas sp. UWO 241]|nr:hypothetical protein FOA52_003225 [Chlamydomonas sp. UWO 241]